MMERTNGHGRARWNVALITGLSGLALTFAVATAWGAGEGEDLYLRGTRGSYRGRVVDAATKQPIAGAVVVAVWSYDRYALVETHSTYYDALEVLTDAQGNFVVDAPDIERRAPRRTRFPVFTIFKPGYLYFRGWFADEEVMAERAKRPLLGVVELERIAGRGRMERLRNAGVRPGGGIPDDKMPNLLRAMEEESRGLRNEH